MTTEDYVSFETAKLLKEKGFDEPCYAYWHEDENKLVISQSMHAIQNITNPCFFGLTVPTLQMAMKWLREVHNIDIAIYAENAFLGKRYSTSIWKDITKRNEKDGAIIVAGAITYEEAVETSIKYCLENLL